MIGLDYYLTSERFLDENLERYPESTHGTNGKHVYADIEAIRVNHKKVFGPLVLFSECWKRYHVPLAITEVHIHGSPFRTNRMVQLYQRKMFTTNSDRYRHPGNNGLGDVWYVRLE